jgi:CO/xanthine dehydrogenase FAD-binding subunit
MHPLSLSYAPDAASAIAAHTRDPGLAFIGGGTDLIGLMKDRAALSPNAWSTLMACRS